MILKSERRRFSSFSSVVAVFLINVVVAGKSTAFCAGKFILFTDFNISETADLQSFSCTDHERVETTNLT